MRFGLSRRTVVPPTTTASDRARSAHTCCLAAGPVTHALCPEVVAIFPSTVMAYLKMLNGLPVATRCRRWRLASRHRAMPSATAEAARSSAADVNRGGELPEDVHADARVAERRDGLAPDARDRVEDPDDDARYPRSDEGVHRGVLADGRSVRGLQVEVATPPSARAPASRTASTSERAPPWPDAGRSARPPHDRQNRAARTRSAGAG